MATFDGAVAGAIGGITLCHLVFYGMSHGPKKSGLRDGCMYIGAAGGGAGALYGSLQAEDRPDKATWIAVSTLAVIGVLGVLVNIASRNDD
jgi:hypothetical protein